MIENIENMYDILVPYNGYKEGWNIVIYQDNNHNFNDLKVTLMNSDMFEEEDAEELAYILEVRCYLIINFNVTEDVMEEVEKSLKQAGFHYEKIYRNIISSDVIKPTTKLISKKNQKEVKNN